MITGRTDYVFSGDDDQAVIVPLPLAFLRLIHSGVYTYEIDWRDQEWEVTQITSEQLAIIEGALSNVSEAVDGIGAEVAGMILLDAGLVVSTQSGTTGNPSQVQVLKSNFPSIQEATAVLVTVKSSANEDTLMTGFKYGSAANQVIQTLKSGDNMYNQFVIPCDQTGFKVNLQIFDHTYFNYQFVVNGYWE